MLEWTLQRLGTGWFSTPCSTQAIFQAPLTVSFSHLHFSKNPCTGLQPSTTNSQEWVMPQGLCLETTVKRRQSGKGHLERPLLPRVLIALCRSLLLIS